MQLHNWAGRSDNITESLQTNKPSIFLEQNKKSQIKYKPVSEVSNFTLRNGWKTGLTHQNIKNRNIIFEYSDKLVFKRYAKPRKVVEKVAMSHYHVCLNKRQKIPVEKYYCFEIQFGVSGPSFTSLKQNQRREE